MKVITRDSHGVRRVINVDEVRTSRHNVRTTRPMRRPISRITADADEKEPKLTKEQADFLAELVKSGVSVDDIVKAVKGGDDEGEDEDKEEELPVDKPEDEDEPDDEVEEDFDFGEEEEVKDLGDGCRFGDSVKKREFKSIGAIAKRKATDSVDTNSVDEKWAKALNKSWSK